MRPRGQRRAQKALGLQPPEREMPIFHVPTPVPDGSKLWTGLLYYLEILRLPREREQFRDGGRVPAGLRRAESSQIRFHDFTHVRDGCGWWLIGDECMEWADPGPCSDLRWQWAWNLTSGQSCPVSSFTFGSVAWWWQPAASSSSTAAARATPTATRSSPSAWRCASLPRRVSLTSF